MSILGLGGEGILRTHGRMDEAVPVIRRAIDEGVTYFDTAPAYDGSRDYLGAALGPDRARIFLASKTHLRDGAGTRRLLDDSLKRLKTSHIDLLQLHDLRSMDELDEIFASDGALPALLKARDEKTIRFIGLTGHHDVRVLREALRRFAFDAVLTVVNAAEPHGSSFMRDVIPEARRQQMGVVGMKVLARQRVFSMPGTETPQKALRYAWSQQIDVAIVGCGTPVEVSENAAAARAFIPLSPEENAALEARGKSIQAAINPWKHG